MAKTLTPQEIRQNIQLYIAPMSREDDNPPTRYGFAKKLGYVSYKALQRDMALYSDEGRDVLEELDNEINIWLIQWLARAESKEDILKRKHILSLQGLGEKQAIDLGLGIDEKKPVNFDFLLGARIKALGEQKIKTIATEAKI